MRPRLYICILVTNLPLLRGLPARSNSVQERHIVGGSTQRCVEVRVLPAPVIRRRRLVNTINKMSQRKRRYRRAVEEHHMLPGRRAPKGCGQFSRHPGESLQRVGKVAHATSRISRHPIPPPHTHPELNKVGKERLTQGKLPIVKIKASPKPQNPLVPVPREQREAPRISVYRIFARQPRIDRVPRRKRRSFHVVSCNWTVVRPSCARRASRGTVQQREPVPPPLTRKFPVQR